MEVRDRNNELLRQKEFENMKEMFAEAFEEFAKEDVGSVTLRKFKSGNQASELQKQNRDMRR